MENTFTRMGAHFEESVHALTENDQTMTRITRSFGALYTLGGVAMAAEGQVGLGVGLAVLGLILNRADFKTQ